MEKKRILLGMSGGTDSSVAAMILQEQGYEVHGITFRFYEPGDDTSYLGEVADLSSRLGIAHTVYDARSEFEHKIVSYFIDEYISGKTPVPCIVCNNTLKWPLLVKVADAMGIPFVATGHYVKRVMIDSKYYIVAGSDPDKDQSFFLWGLDQGILQRIVLPLGGMTKMEVRRKAAIRGFKRVSEKKDSLGVCFCPGDYRSFLKKKMGEEFFKTGFYEDNAGKIIGKHEGYPFYTIGQRRGLGVNLNTPLFVKDVNPENNRVVLSPLSGLYKSRMLLKDVKVVDPSDFDGRFDVHCRIRYRKQNTLCTVHFHPSGKAEVHFLEPVSSIAPGQAAAFYCQDRVLGGGIIVSAE